MNIRHQVQWAHACENRLRVALTRIQPRWVVETDDMLEAIMARRKAGQAWVKVLEALLDWLRE